MGYFENKKKENAIDISKELAEIREERDNRWKAIIRLYDTLNVPREYKWTPNMCGCDCYVGVSDRSRAKTTNSLLIGLCAYKLFNWTSGYFRNTAQDGVKANMETLCDVINQFGYVKALFPQYDRIVYHYMGGYWCMLNSESGDESEPIMYKFIVDKYVNYLGRNEINCNIFIYDEFMHDEYENDRFMHYLSLHKTLSRERTDIYQILISNTTDINHPFLRELGLGQIAKKIKRGQNRLVQLEKGTILRFEMFGNIMEESAQKTRAIVNALYYGYDNPRISVITGEGQDWGTNYYDPIIYSPSDKVVYNNIKLHYNLQWYSLTLVNNKEIGLHLNIKPYNDPIQDNHICIVDRTPQNKHEFYGLSHFRPLVNLFNDKKVFYSDCYTGDSITAFLKSVR